MSEPGKTEDIIYDCIIAGGGLAGLSLAMQLSTKGRKVLILEKNSYPFHKVCGEYLSMESYAFLERLGIPLRAMALPRINRLLLTSTDGDEVMTDLDLGGIGISRYVLDEALAKAARAQQVTVKENVKVNGYRHIEDLVTVQTNSGMYTGRILCASFGKHPPGNFHKPGQAAENWVGVKYHVRYPFPEDRIALHTFKDGYCGISRIEGGLCCLCYLVNASRLKENGGDISLLEKTILSQNSHLRQIFRQAEFISHTPVTVSNVQFSLRKPVSDKIFYLGDSAGCIAPLSGNGMSMALRASFILSGELNRYFDGRQTLDDSLEQYQRSWIRQFRKRILLGQYLQYLFCKPALTGLFISIMSRLPFLRKRIVRNTHGLPF